MDSKYIESYQEGDQSEDEILQELEAEMDADFDHKYRQRRIEELARELKESKSNANQLRQEVSGQDNVITLLSDKEVIDRTLQNTFTVIHFFNENFQTCRIIDDKLQEISRKHLGVRFFRVDATKTPFLVAKLGLKVLPVLVFYRKGLEADRVVGLERLSQHGESTHVSKNLQELLLCNGFISREFAF